MSVRFEISLRGQVGCSLYTTEKVVDVAAVELVMVP
jgi:hypothetical protein